MQDFGLDAHIVRSVHLPPAPRFMDAIGHNYKFETAVADLIDNSIDAGSRTVLARFIRVSGVITGFALVDDGRGVASDKLASAMTLGGDREYDDNSLGYFGIGLKASSFSQANSLTLVSRDASNTGAGMRWLAEKAPNCATTQKHLDEGSVEHAYWHCGYQCALRDVKSMIRRSSQ